MQDFTVKYIQIMFIVVSSLNFHASAFLSKNTWKPSTSKMFVINDEKLSIMSTDSLKTSNPDFSLYALITALQFLPPLTILEISEQIRKPLGYMYFVGTASLAVYLGSKLTISMQSPNVISKKRALLAPVFSSIFLFSLYLLLKYTDVEVYFDKIYQFSATILGISSIDYITSSNFYESKPVDISESNGSTENLSELSIPSTNKGIFTGLVVGLSYLIISNFGGSSPEALCASSFFNNVLALNIALISIGTIAVENFMVACALLIGLFFYDIFWVFGSDVMMTVATKVEAPIKFLVPADPLLMATRKYPFSVLGLGDIVVPGIMCSLARRLDTKGMEGYKVFSSQPVTIANTPTVSTASFSVSKSTPPDEKISLFDQLLVRLKKNNDISSDSMTSSTSPILLNTKRKDIVIEEVLAIKSANGVKYLDASIVGYTVGLLLAFTVNEITHAGQPALLYLVPCVISSILYAAFKNGEIRELLSSSS